VGISECMIRTVMIVCEHITVSSYHNELGLMCSATAGGGALFGGGTTTTTNGSALFGR